MSDGLSSRVGFYQRQAETIIPSVNQGFAEAIEPLIQETLLQRRAALASGWAWQKKVDEAARLSAQTGMKFYPGDTVQDVLSRQRTAAQDAAKSAASRAEGLGLSHGMAGEEKQIDLAQDPDYLKGYMAGQDQRFQGQKIEGEVRETKTLAESYGVPWQEGDTLQSIKQRAQGRVADLGMDPLEMTPAQVAAVKDPALRRTVLALRQESGVQGRFNTMQEWRKQQADRAVEMAQKVMDFRQQMFAYTKDKDALQRAEGHMDDLRSAAKAIVGMQSDRYFSMEALGPVEKQAFEFLEKFVDEGVKAAGENPKVPPPVVEPTGKPSARRLALAEKVKAGTATPAEMDEYEALLGGK